MTPDELATRHPRLYHVSEPGAHESIRQHGLLSTNAILDLFEVETQERQRLTTARRATAVPLKHPLYGTMILNDNLPLSEKALENCLDDGLTPSDWLRTLNSRVFFWVDEAGLQRLLGAKMNRGDKERFWCSTRFSSLRLTWTRSALARSTRAPQFENPRGVGLPPSHLQETTAMRSGAGCAVSRTRLSKSLSITRYHVPGSSWSTSSSDRSLKQSVQKCGFNGLEEC